METSPSALQARRNSTHKKRRWIALGLGVVAGVCLAVLVSNANHGSSGLGKLGANRASLSTFAGHYWWGHGRLFAIHRSGRGAEKLRTYAAAPLYATLTSR
jgi:hypothetical protein